MTDFLLFDPLEFHTVLNKIRYALIAYQILHNSTLIANLMQIVAILSSHIIYISSLTLNLNHGNNDHGSDHGSGTTMAVDER